MAFDRLILLLSPLACWVCWYAPAVGQTPVGPEHFYNRWESHTTQSFGIRLGTFEQTRHWAPMPSWSHPQLAHENSGDELNLLRPHPMPVTGSGVDPLFKFDPLAIAMRPIRNITEKLYENNIRIAVTDVLVYQNVSRSFNNQAENSLYNRFDVSPSIRAWELDGHGNGIFTAQ